MKLESLPLLTPGHAAVVPIERCAPLSGEPLPVAGTASSEPIELGVVEAGDADEFVDELRSTLKKVKDMIFVESLS